MSVADEEIKAVEALFAAAQAEDQVLAAHAAWLSERDAVEEARRGKRMNWFYLSQPSP